MTEGCPEWCDAGSRHEGPHLSSSQMAMGRRWSFDEHTITDYDDPGHGETYYAFTDHRDDDVKFIVGDCSAEIAKMVYDALNHRCHGHDESECEDGICPWGDSARKRGEAEPL